MKSLMRIAFAIIALFVLSSAALADGLAFDSALGGPGWYNGTGNPNGGFTVSTQNGVEIGLRAKGRQLPGVIDSPNNVYNVLAGSQVGNPARAWWNYEWSINLRPGNAGSMVLTDVFPYSTLTVQDLTAGVSNTVSFPYWGDNSTFGPSGKQDAGPGNGFGATLYPVNWGAQNSENPVFGDFPPALVPGYTFDMNAAHYYRFTLDVKNFAGLLASGTIDVAVGGATAPTSVPEPNVMMSLMIGLLGMGFMSRWRSANN